MEHHPVDPVSGALGVIVITMGVLVRTDAIGALDRNGGWWFALVALIVGVGLIPWNRRDVPAAADEPSVDVEDASAPAADRQT